MFYSFAVLSALSLTTPTGAGCFLPSHSKEEVTAILKGYGLIRLHDQTPGRFGYSLMDGDRPRQDLNRLKYLPSVPHLVHLYINYPNGLSDAEIQSVAKVEALESVGFAGGEVSDRQLKFLLPLKKLQSVSVEFSPVTVEGVKTLATMDSLRTLGFGECPQIDDEALEVIGKMTKLRQLGFGGCPKLDDRMLARIGTLTELRNFGIGYCNGITDKGLETIGKFKKLESLQLSFLKFDGSGLKHLRDLSELRFLQLEGNELKDEHLEHLQAFSKLEELILCSDSLTDNALKHLPKLGALRSLKLTGKRFNRDAVFSIPWGRSGPYVDFYEPDKK